MFFERLKDRVAQESSEQDVDHLVRAEVKSIYYEFPGSPSGSPYAGDDADADPLSSSLLTLPACGTLWISLARLSLSARLNADYFQSGACKRQHGDSPPHPTLRQRR